MADLLFHGAILVFHLSEKCALNTTSEQTGRWKPVPGYDYYSVSDDGRVRSEARFITRQSGKGDMQTHTRELHPSIDRKGYQTVILFDSKLVTPRIRRQWKVHSLVLLAFVGPCPPGMQRAHNDGNPANNCLYNLCYKTPQQNCQDRDRHGTTARGDRAGRAILTEQTVVWLRDKYDTGNYTYKQLAGACEVSYSAVYFAINRVSWDHI